MNTKPIAARILSRLIDRIGRSTWLQLSDGDRLLIESCCLDAADLQLAVLQSGDDPSIADVLRREKAHVSAQIASLSAARGLAVERVLWESASRLLTGAAAALLAP